MYVAWVIVGIVLLYFLIFVPIQYRYLAHVRQDMKQSKLTQDEYYDSKPLWELSSHYTMQSPVMIPANLVASFIWRMKNSSSKS